MSGLKRLIGEIHRRSLWQVLGIYLAASWVAVQVVETLTEGMNLPAWVLPFSIVLLVIGLPIVLATAFVQEGTGRGAPAAEHEAPDARLADSPETARTAPAAAAQESAPTVAAAAGGPRGLFTWRNAILGGVLAFSLLFGLAGLFVLLRSPDSPFGPAEAVADEAAPAIAVLPFQVQGQSVAELREGMVELLSTNLDGVAGLRAIDSRTVMARYRARVRGDEAPDLETALAVARDARARYLLTGSAVALGREVRMSAEIHDTSSGDKLGAAQVQGSPDDVFALVDRLSIETLGAILGDQVSELPRVDLARATTQSLPALRAYLEGSAYFRESDFDRAARGYERAVQADSTFALAYYRLSDAVGWAESIMSEVGQGAIDQAARYSDRLPEREASLVRGNRALIHGDHRGIEAVSELVRRYPDDVEAWYLLGELHLHQGLAGLSEYGAAAEAFERAIQLDPGFSPAHIHYVDYAFFHEPDSARVEARLAAYARIAPDSDHWRDLRLAADLAFGGEARRARAVAALDTTRANLRSLAFTNLAHPRLLDAQTALVAALERRGDGWAPLTALYNRLARGRLAEAAAGLREAEATPWIEQEGAFQLHQLAALSDTEVVPRARLDAWLDLAAADSTSAVELFYAGAYAADRGRAGEAAEAARLLRAEEARRLAAGDTTTATFAGGAVAAIEGFGAAAAGDGARAVALLEDARRRMIGNYPFIACNQMVRWRAGRILAASGRYAEAVPYLASAYYETGSRLELARAREATGDVDGARIAYEELVAAWHDAEPAVRPLVEEATRRILELSAEFGGRGAEGGDRPATDGGDAAPPPGPRPNPAGEGF